MRSEDERSHATSLPAAITWCGVGVILLLLGAANDLTVWVGQCAFALGAVLLWITTPELPRNDAHALEARVGGGLTLVLLCAVVHAAAMLVVPTPYLPIAGAIVIAEATMLLMLTAVQSGSHACIRLGGWCATYGVLLSLGAISLRQMIPQTLLAAGGDRGVPPVKVAYGFGAFAFEAMILIAISAAALAFDRLHTRQLRFTLAFALILLAAVLAAWRLSMM